MKNASLINSHYIKEYHLISHPNGSGTSVNFVFSKFISKAYKKVSLRLTRITCDLVKHYSTQKGGMWPIVSEIAS